ncbi:MAG: hypothetical protein M3245_01680, partial [Actinomycetota bacterium]|nr:hypothetical protein [Actinomycetota bacterium]
MKRSLIAAALSAFLLPVTAPVGAGQPDADRSSPGVVRGRLGAARAAPLVAAAHALRGWADGLGVDASEFVFEHVRRSIVGTHVRGRQYRGGVPVDGSWAAVHIV